jgi:hypothetical protein
VTSIVRDRTILYSGKQPDRMPPALALTVQKRAVRLYSTPRTLALLRCTFASGQVGESTPNAPMTFPRRRLGHRLSHPIGVRRLSFN